MVISPALSEFAVPLVLAAAFLHAAWNAAFKGGGDTASAARMIILVEAGIAASVAPFVGLPAPASWPWLAVTGLAHVVYWLALIEAYRHGELSAVYPIARGSAPLLVALGAALLAAEWPSAGLLLGIALISGGVLAMARAGPDTKPRAVGMALLTALSIAAYSVADGIGVRLSQAPLGFIAWSFITDGVLAMAAFALLGMRFRKLTVPERGKAAFAGVASLIAYGIAIWAMSVVPIALVSALRESSVLFAVLMGWLLFKESIGARRIAACLAIAAGTAVLALTR